MVRARVRDLQPRGAIRAERRRRRERRRPGQLRRARRLRRSCERQAAAANLRPQVFQRGPNGDASAPLFSPALAEGRRVALGAGERRVWIRGAGAERLIDLHKEEGPMTIVVPGDDRAAAVDRRVARGERRPPSTVAGRVRRCRTGTAIVMLDELDRARRESAARGGGAMFGELFKAPYGAARLHGVPRRAGRARPSRSSASRQRRRSAHAALPDLHRGERPRHLARAGHLHRRPGRRLPGHREWRRLPRTHRWDDCSLGGGILVGSSVSPCSAPAFISGCPKRRGRRRSRRSSPSCTPPPRIAAPPWSPTSNRALTMWPATSDACRTFWPRTWGSPPWCWPAPPRSRRSAAVPARAGRAGRRLRELRWWWA